MGNKFLALRKSEVAKVAPDRAALIGKIGQAMYIKTTWTGSIRKEIKN